MLRALGRRPELPNRAARLSRWPIRSTVVRKCSKKFWASPYDKLAARPMGAAAGNLACRWRSRNATRGSPALAHLAPLRSGPRAQLRQGGLCRRRWCARQQQRPLQPDAAQDLSPPPRGLRPARRDLHGCAARRIDGQQELGPRPVLKSNPDRKPPRQAYRLQPDGAGDGDLRPAIRRPRGRQRGRLRRPGHRSPAAQFCHRLVPARRR